MTLPAAYFDALYARDRDPWGFETRWYEQRKYAVTVASLPKPHYRSGLEIGCSVGVLTALLADRCDSLLAVDAADAAVAAARQRLGGRPGIEVARMAMPQEWPAGSFDLIVVSEVGYYLAESDLHDLISKASNALESDGVLVAAHWRHAVADYPLDGDQVHATIAASSGLARLARHEEADFLLEVFTPEPAVSVARATGLLP
jgi:SAM-dependent methyltransferase